MSLDTKVVSSKWLMFLRPLLVRGILFIVMMACSTPAECDVRVSLQNRYTKIGLSDLNISNNAWTVSGYALHAKKGDSLEKFLSYTKDQIRTNFRTYLKDNPDLNPKTNDLVTLDIESPVHPSEFGKFASDPVQQKKIMEAFKVRIKVAREELPNAQLSLFAVIKPNARGKSDGSGFDRMMQGYIKAGEEGVYDSLDLLSPVLYVRFGPDEEGSRHTEAYSRQGIEFTNKLKTSTGKTLPLAPFLSPNIYNSNSEHHLRCAPVDIVRRQLAVLREYSYVQTIIFWLGKGEGASIDKCPVRKYFEELKP